MNNGIVLKKTKDSGYDVFITSTDIDQGTYHTSYVFLGHAKQVIHTETCDALKLQS
jgi:hypothetical protein